MFVEKFLILIMMLVSVSGVRVVGWDTTNRKDSSLCIWYLCVLQVLEHYRQEGFQFLLRVFNEPMYLEDLTGLRQMHQDTMDAEVSTITSNCGRRPTLTQPQWYRDMSVRVDGWDKHCDQEEIVSESWAPSSSLNTLIDTENPHHHWTPSSTQS